MSGGGQQGAPGFSSHRLRKARLAAGLTQEQLSAALGVHETVIVHWERGERIPRVDRLGQLAKLLNINPADLTDPPETGPPSLRRLRVNAGLLQDEVASHTGLSRQKYATLERGEVARLTDHDATALANTLGVTLDDVRTAHAISRAAFLNR